MTGGPLPTGTLTFLFTDVEGSTRLAELDPSGYLALLGRHGELLRMAFEAHGGVEVSTEGDGFFIVFERATAAAQAAIDAQRALAAEAWPPEREVRVRMGLHTGEAAVRERTYLGHDVNRAARIAAAGHGGQILVSEATAPLISASLPAGTMLRALGYHRLKDLRPEHLCQLDVEGLQTDFPPIRSLDVRANNLPTQLTSFVGRESEVRDVAALLERARLVTLTGPGGTGKTRLSLQVAAEIAGRFPDGVTWVPLADIADPSLVASQLAAALGLQDVGGRSSRDRLADHLRDRTSLLVLDNFEQVVTAGPLLADLLREAPKLRLLVSSRIVLRISGEHEYAVPPLALGPAEDGGTAGDSEAVRLFLDRATAARPGFALDDRNAAAVAAIVARLDGLPLAIELAAARSRLLGPEALLDRLEHRLDMLTTGSRDLPARQQTLRGAIAWSHDLLDPPVARLFARFSVFVGGARLEESETVCGTAAELGVDVLDGLGALVDHSLLRQTELDGEPRFAMLATIQEFAAEQLAAGDERETIRRRHAIAYLDLAEAAAPHLTGSDGAVWLDQVGREHDNLRAAVAWATDQREASVAARLVSALWRFWQIRGHLAEGRERADRVVALLTPDLPADLRARTYDAAGGLLYWLGDFRAAVDRYELQLAACREVGEPDGVAQALYNLAFPLVFGRIDFARAESAAAEAEATFRSLGNRSGLARSLWLLANLANQRRDPATSREYCLQALPILRELREPFMLGWCLFTLAQTSILEHRNAEGREHLLEAVDWFEAAGDVSGLILVLDALAFLEWRAGEPLRSARVSGAVAHLEATTGTALNVNNRQVLDWDPQPLREDPLTAAAWRTGAGDSTAAILAFVRERRTLPDPVA
jgi:predicted ATPase/class 3 adenylate cyclase